MKLKADITKFLDPNTVMAGKDEIDKSVKRANVQIGGKGLEK